MKASAAKCMLLLSKVLIRKSLKRINVALLAS